MVMRSRPAALDGSVLKLPVEVREHAQAQACQLQLAGGHSTASGSTAAQTPASTSAPSWVSPRSSRSSTSCSFVTAQTSCPFLSPRAGGELRRTVTTLHPAPGFTPHAGTSVASAKVAATPTATLQRSRTVTIASPSPTADSGAAQPLLQRTVSVSGGVVPSSSPIAAATPTTILRKYGPAPGMPYPPGMGFTPAAQKVGVLQRKISFGLSSGAALGAEGAGSLLQKTTSVVSVAEEEGAYAREMLLFFRMDAAGLAGEGLSAEEAGFLLPQPGWLRTCKEEEASPQSAPVVVDAASGDVAAEAEPAQADQHAHAQPRRWGNGAPHAQGGTQRKAGQGHDNAHHKQQAGNGKERWSYQEWWEWQQQQTQQHQQHQQQQQRSTAGNGNAWHNGGKGRGKGKHW